MVQFFELLKNERIRLGLTQDEISSACGIAKRTYNYYENGERAPNTDFLFAFAQIGGDVNYLFTGERTKERLEPLEKVALLAFNKLKEEGLKTSAITYMTMLEAGLIKGDFNSLWDATKNGIHQNITDSTVENIAGGNITVNKG